MKALQNSLVFLQKTLIIKKSLIALVLLCLSTTFISIPIAFGNEKNTVAVHNYGDTFITGLLGEPSNFLPFIATDKPSHDVASFFYVSPLKYDKNLNVIPYAAETFDVLDDGLRLVFTLRKGIYWQDGVELTADDVEFTYKMMIDPKTPTAYAGDFKSVSSFKKRDKYTFEVCYDKPFARSVVTWMLSIMPKHKLEGVDLRTTSLARRPISSGPFLFDSWEAGASVRLLANDMYFLGRPFFDGIVYKIIPDISTMFLELKAQTIDMMGLTPQQYLYQAQTTEFKEQFTTYRSLDFSYTYLGYNLRNPLFSDVRVRKALAYAINKEDIIKGALMGQGVSTIGPYKPGTWAYNTKVKNYPVDYEKALTLLAAAGWVKESDGILRKNGKPFVFTLLVNQGNELRIKTAIIIQSQLKNLGIEVKIRAVEWAAFLKQFITPGNFDAAILAWNILQDPDSYDVWHSSRINGGLNFIGYANSEVDTLLEEARTTFKQTLRKKLYDRFQEILHDEQPYAFLYVPHLLTAVQKRIHGIEPAPAGLTHNFTDWWVPLNDQRYRMLAK